MIEVIVLFFFYVSMLLKRKCRKIENKFKNKKLPKNTKQGTCQKKQKLTKYEQ